MLTKKEAQQLSEATKERDSSFLSSLQTSCMHSHPSGMHKDVKIIQQKQQDSVVIATDWYEANFFYKETFPIMVVC